ncbi:hypothetical protein M9H77_28786 [Catharanthus roseus]|uniref:Uncharacterized protein n=1 Tax=Catharanthus roseus TaxID=4058 RepID=A0ACC0AKM7_CATRO|nr:hypothetical protein M9H77_28786 [Catharanthus roseus]
MQEAEAEIPKQIIAPDLYSGPLPMTWTVFYSEDGSTLKRGRSTTSHHTLRWDRRLVESQEGLETKIGLRAELLTQDDQRRNIIYFISHFYLMTFYDGRKCPYTTAMDGSSRFMLHDIYISSLARE